MEVVKSISKLRQLERAGYITLHEHTGTKVTSPFGIVTAWYISDNTKSVFTHGNDKYEVKYFDGSFYPYVVWVGRVNDPINKRRY